MKKKNQKTLEQKCNMGITLLEFDSFSELKDFFVIA